MKSGSIKIISIALVFILANIVSAQNSGLKLNNLLKIKGLNISAGYTGEVFSTVEGGMGKESLYLDNIDIIMEADLETLVSWPNATLNVYVLGNNGEVPGDYAGTGQGISNIAAYDTWKLYEFWIDQKIGENFSIRAGLYDLNSEFDTRESSSIFINPSHGIGAEFAMTGENGPSIFPTTSLAVRLKYKPTKFTYIQTAIYEGVPGDLNNPNGTQITLEKDEGALISTEAGLISEAGPLTKDYYKLSFGGWYYTKEFLDLNEVTANGEPIKHDGNYGLYLSGEKNIFYEDADPNQGMTFFTRIGFANDDVNQFDYYFGTGFTYIGLIPGRDEDVFGVALASANNCDKFVDASKKELNLESKQLESIIELTYDFKINENVSIQPDLQYVINPTFCKHNDYAMVVGGRLNVAF